MSTLAKTKANAPAALPPDVQAEIDEAKALGESLLADIEATPASDTAYHNEGLRHAIEKLGILRTKRDFVLAPMKEAIARLEALFKPGMAVYTAVERAERAKLAEYATLQARQAAEARREAQALAANNQVALAVRTLQAAPQPPQKAEGLSYRKTWRWVVKDLAKVPTGLLQLNDTAVRQVIAGHETDPSKPPVVAGLEFSLEVTPISRSTK